VSITFTSHAGENHQLKVPEWHKLPHCLPAEGWGRIGALEGAAESEGEGEGGFAGGRTVTEEVLTVGDLALASRQLLYL